MEFPTLLNKYDFGANLISNDVRLQNVTRENNFLPPLVMSVAIGYPLDRFEAFVGSLRGSGYSGDVRKIFYVVCFHVLSPKVTLSSSGVAVDI